jgi:hypothetical protein
VYYRKMAASATAAKRSAVGIKRKAASTPEKCTCAPPDASVKTDDDKDIDTSGRWFRGCNKPHCHKLRAAQRKLWDVLMNNERMRFMVELAHTADGKDAIDKLTDFGTLLQSAGLWAGPEDDASCSSGSSSGPD